MRARGWAPVLQALLVGRVLADDCSTTVTVTTAAPAMASCATFSGDVVVASTFSGVVNMTGVETIVGRVIATSVPSLEGIRLPALVSAEGIEVSDAPAFNTFDFGLDSSADYASLGDVEFSNLGALPGYTFAYINGLGNLTFDNVSSDYLWFQWEASNVAMQDLVLVNNPLLENVSIPLVSAQELSVTSNSVMGWLGMDYVTEISAATITANPSMTSVELPSLTAVAGDFILHADHNVYLDLNSSMLKSVGGNIELVGDISWSFDEDVVVNGTVTVTYDATAGDEYKCSEITPGVLTITCNGDILSASSTGAGGTVTVTAGAGNGAASAHTSSTGSSSAAAAASSGLSSTAKIGIGLGVALGVIGIVAIIAAILLMLRLRKKRAASRDGPGDGPGQPGGIPLSEQKLPPPYSTSLWRGFSTKKKSGTGSAEPMMPGQDGGVDAQGMPIQQGPQELHGSEGVTAHELESPRMNQAGFAPMTVQGQPQQPPVEMEGDHNWRRSELMAEPVVNQAR